MTKKESSSFGVFIIIVGLAILLVNLDILKISMFWGIVDLWPFLLIVAGLSMIFRRVRYMSAVLWLLFIGGVIAYSYLQVDDQRWSFGETAVHETETFTIESKENADLHLNIRQGSIDVDTGLKELLYYIPAELIEKKEINQTDETISLLIEDTDHIDIVNNFQDRNYEITMPETENMFFELDAGVASGRIDFSDVAVKELDIEIGVGDLEIYLSEASTGEYRIDIGIGDLTLYIPEGMDVKIVSDGGLKSVSAPGYDKKDGVYTSKNYGLNNTLVIYVDLGIGSLEVE